MRLAAGTAALALAIGVGAAHAQDLMVPIGEGDFDWESYEAFAEAHD